MDYCPPSKGPHVPDIVVACLLHEVAHRHVFDHAPAQRADGLLTHRGAPVLRWRLVDPSILKTGPRLVIVSRLLRHSIGATGSAPRAARSRKAGSFFGHFSDVRGALREV